MRVILLISYIEKSHQLLNTGSSHATHFLVETEDIKSQTVRTPSTNLVLRSKHRRKISGTGDYMSHTTTESTPRVPRSKLFRSKILTKFYQTVSDMTVIVSAEASGVTCGGHRAKTCELCTKGGKGKDWCNGECEWSDGKCHPEGSIGIPIEELLTKVDQS